MIMSNAGTPAEKAWAWRREIITACDNFILYDAKSYDLSLYQKLPELKGVYDGNCNRTACQLPGAAWYNLSTQAYYCPICARDINLANMFDAVNLYGSPFLCIPPSHKDHPHYTGG